jgi:acetylornithine deacetylase/succinyl-diaminopimelate desuccinylase-like protein
MQGGQVTTAGTVTFVANVGEEGLGDLRGVKELFGVQSGRDAATVSRRAPIDSFVSIDGPGYHVTHVGVGSRRYRVTFSGPGGHSFGDFGTPSAVTALGRAVARIGEIQVPPSPRTTFNVGRIGGGTAVNAVPSEAWFEADLRSADAGALMTLDAQFLNAVDAAVKEENARWGSAGAITVRKALVGSRPSGVTPLGAPIVQTALAAGRALGLTTFASEGSTDANIPMSLGIPGIAIGAGGRGGGAHALTEWFDETDAWKGTQQALLIVIALSAR